MTAKILPFKRITGSVEEISDEALLAACALGERAALGALFDRHYDGVRALLYHLITRDDADLDDLVQITFETVQKSAHRFEMRSGVRTWILGIARNVGRRWIRTRVRQRKMALELVHEPAAASEGPAERALANERRARLMAAAEALTPALREVFVLVYLQGLSGTEAAEVLGIREGAVWKRLHTARKKLSELMGEET